jgi:hypothetical protein
MTNCTNLAECRYSVRIAPVPEKQLGQVAERRNRKVDCEGRLLALFADDADTCSGKHEVPVARSTPPRAT